MREIPSTQRRPRHRPRPRPPRWRPAAPASWGPTSPQSTRLSLQSSSGRARACSPTLLRPTSLKLPSPTTRSRARAALKGRKEHNPPPKPLLVPYLDAQNNVAHLGHSDPHVAAAVSRAFSTLNTNSRYLHPDLVSHAEQLVEMLSSSSSSRSSSSTSQDRNGVDDPVVYYVPSGTEANDLALRIARAFHEEEEEEESRKEMEKTSPASPAATAEGEPTSASPKKYRQRRHRHHYLALDGAYHGHAGEPARVSSYVSFGGAVSSACPSDVSLLRLPDAVRDKNEDDGESANTSSSLNPAPAVRAAAAKARSFSSSSSSSSSSSRAGGSLTAFIFESFPSCAGQVVLPKGWLAAAVAAARKDAEEHGLAPPVVIADEVQTGLGRLGTLEQSSFWAFQHFRVPSPDIVTIGKPAANGFPFGAVVASRRVASAFARNNAPFFSTFGGCTAAAAAALATLEVLRREKLPEKASEVGARLLRDLREMASSLEDGRLVVDVRGVGLMIGVEVAFPEARGFAAAPRVASFVAGHCRNVSKVLVSCDGAGERAGSVLKIKPPLCFSHGDAEELVEALRLGFEAVPRELLMLEEEGED